MEHEPFVASLQSPPYAYLASPRNSPTSDDPQSVLLKQEAVERSSICDIEDPSNSFLSNEMCPTWFAWMVYLPDTTQGST